MCSIYDEANARDWSNRRCYLPCMAKMPPHCGVRAGLPLINYLSAYLSTCLFCRICRRIRLVLLELYVRDFHQNPCRPQRRATFGSPVKLVSFTPSRIGRGRCVGGFWRAWDAVIVFHVTGFYFKYLYTPYVFSSPHGLLVGSRRSCLTFPSIGYN